MKKTIVAGLIGVITFFCAGSLFGTMVLAETETQPGTAPSGFTSPGTAPSGFTNPGTAPGPSGESGNRGASSGGLSSTDSCGQNSGLQNPLKVCSISGFFLAILDILLIFALPIIVLFIMYAGFMYVTARGDVKKVGDAHSALLWAIVGGVIILGAKLIIEVIEGTVSAI